MLLDLVGVKRDAHDDRWPQPVVAGSFARRRIVTGIHDLFSLARIGVAALLAVLLRLVWAIVERLAVYAEHDVPGGLVTGSCVLLFAGLLLLAPVVLSMEGVSVTPLRLVVAPPRGDFGSPPLAVRLAAALYVAAILAGLWLLAQPATPLLAQADRAVVGLLGGSMGLVLVLAAGRARLGRARRSRLRAGA